MDDKDHPDPKRPPKKELLPTTIDIWDKENSLVSFVLFGR